MEQAIRNLCFAAQQSARTLQARNRTVYPCGCEMLGSGVQHLAAGSSSASLRLGLCVQCLRHRHHLAAAALLARAGPLKTSPNRSSIRAGSCSHSCVTAALSCSALPLSPAGPCSCCHRLQQCPLSDMGRMPAPQGEMHDKCARAGLQQHHKAGVAAAEPDPMQD